MEHQIIRIPMVDSIYEELDDAFIGEKETAHDFVWRLIRELCKDAKMGKLNKVCSVNVLKDGKPQQDTVKLKEVNLEEITSNPDWIPKNIDKDDVKYFEHKVTDKTWEYLKLFSSFTLLRHKKYGESLEAENDRKLADLEKNANMKKEQIEDARKNFDETVEKFKGIIPKCLEEVVFSAIYPKISQHVNQNIDKALDKENEELYPKKDKPSK